MPTLALPCGRIELDRRYSSASLSIQFAPIRINLCFWKRFSAHRCDTGHFGHRDQIELWELREIANSARPGLRCRSTWLSILLGDWASSPRVITVPVPQGLNALRNGATGEGSLLHHNDITVENFRRFLSKIFRPVQYNSSCTLRIEPYSSNRTNNKLLEP